jgi:hypothetical protein
MKRAWPHRLIGSARDLVRLVLFLQRRRSIWMSILVVMLLVATLLLYVIQTAAVSPYVYPLF